MVPVLTLPLLFISIDTEAVLAEVLRSGARILIVLVLALLAASLIRRAVGPVIRVAIREQMAGEPEAEIVKRIDTLSDVLYNVAAAAIAAVALVTILPEFGIAVGPLIAGLGLVGLAVSFGAQNLVRDVINGVEILMENQYSRGDFIRVRTTTGGVVSGAVEDINLRRTVLRDTEGAAHFVSHGRIDVASNLTRGHSQVSLVIGVSHGSDLEKAFQIINRIGEELAREPRLAAKIRRPPAVEGIERLGENTVDVRISGSTEPGEQWPVAFELQRRLKAAFDAEGVRFKD